jgi:undecaprenyl-diphosphatase
MQFFETLIEWDRYLLLLINGAHCQWTDHFFWLVSSPLLPLILGITMLLFLIKDNGVKALWFVLFLAIAIAISNSVSSELLKPLVARLRPTHDPTLASHIHVINDYIGGLYGFASSHAANSFAAALFFALLIRQRLISLILFAWAVITAYSRMYLGVHFPLDVLAGIAIGLVSGGFAYYLMELISSKVNRAKLRLPAILPRKEAVYFALVAMIALVYLAIRSCF